MSPDSPFHRGGEHRRWTSEKKPIVTHHNLPSDWITHPPIGSSVGGVPFAHPQLPGRLGGLKTTGSAFANLDSVSPENYHHQNLLNYIRNRNDSVLASASNPSAHTFLGLPGPEPLRAPSVQELGDPDQRLVESLTKKSHKRTLQQSTSDFSRVLQGSVEAPYSSVPIQNGYYVGQELERGLLQSQYGSVLEATGRGSRPSAVSAYLDSTNLPHGGASSIMRHHHAQFLKAANFVRSRPKLIDAGGGLSCGKH